jgi:hypothetical protein
MYLIEIQQVCNTIAQNKPGSQYRFSKKPGSETDYGFSGSGFATLVKSQVYVNTKYCKDQTVEKILIQYRRQKRAII